MIHAIFAPPSTECVPISIEIPRISCVEIWVVEGNREFRTSRQNICFRNANFFRHHEHATTNKLASMNSKTACMWCASAAWNGPGERQRQTICGWRVAGGKNGGMLWHSTSAPEDVAGNK